MPGLRRDKSNVIERIIPMFREIAENTTHISERDGGWEGGGGGRGGGKGVGDGGLVGRCDIVFVAVNYIKSLTWQDELLWKGAV